jgi:hypothetical protein
MTTTEYINRYWNYYLFIEKKFVATTDYVSLVNPNFETYSNEFVSLLQLIGSENDVIIKECCSYPGDKNKTMKNYKNDLILKYPNLSNEEIRVRNSGIKIKPFEDIRGNSMRWWNAYNNVKHNRVNFLSSAKLVNVLYGLMGLFLLNRLLLNEIDENHYYLMNQSALFKTTVWGEQAKNAIIAINEEPCLIIEDEE